MSTNRLRSRKKAAGALVMLAVVVGAEASGARATLRRACDSGLASIEQRLTAAWARRIAAAYAAGIAAQASFEETMRRAERENAASAAESPKKPGGAKAAPKPTLSS